MPKPNSNITVQLLLILLVAALKQPEVGGQQVSVGGSQALLGGTDRIDRNPTTSDRSDDRPRPRGGGSPAPSRAAPAFAVEPPALLEYSNSTGATLECRAVQWRGASQPAAVSWRRIRRLPTPDTPSAEEAPLEGAGQRVRQDGALVLTPFAGEQDDGIAASLVTYRCCLSNRMGSLCSRPVHTRAVIDSPVNVEVFDELALPGQSAALRCHLPTNHVSAYLEVVGWLRDERPLISSNRQTAAITTTSPQMEALNSRYLMLPSGHLYLRNVSQSDAGAYKCRVRHRLSGAIFTSPVGGRLLVEAPPTSGRASPEMSELRPLGPRAPIVWAREHSAALLCAPPQHHSPGARFAWYRLSGSSATPQPALGPDFRPIEACLLIAQVQQRHAGDYLCETLPPADRSRPSVNGSRVKTRLIVSSAQLSAHLQLVTHQQQQQQQQSQQQPTVPAGSVGRTTSSSQPQTVQVGAQLYLNCSIAGFPYDTVAWFKDGHLLAVTSTTGGSTHLQQQQQPFNGAPEAVVNNLRLVQATVIVIDGFQLNNRGLYQCQVYSARALLNDTSSAVDAEQVAELRAGGYLAVAERDYLRSASSSLQLEPALSKPAIVQRFPSSQTIELHNGFSLQCTFAGLPLPRVTWFLDGIPVGPAATLDAPEWAVPLPELDSELDWTAVDSSSSSSSFEMIDDERFQISLHLAGSTTSGSAWPLLVSQLNVSQVSGSETGQYRCMATSPLGSSQHVGQLNVVLGAGGNGNLALELRTYQPTNVTLVAGRTASLQCPLVGYPLARVDWFHNQRRLPNNHRQHLEPVRAGVGGQLELANLDKTTDGGLYTCRASLQLNNTTSGESSEQQQTVADDSLPVAQVRVSVRVAPLIDPQSLPEVVQANEGMRTKLVCSVVEGDHPVEIRWFKRATEPRSFKQVQGRSGSGSSSSKSGSLFAGFELMQNSASSSDDADDSITIHNLEDSCLLTFKQISYLDSAEYLCVAQNELSRSVRLTRVVVNVPPAWSWEPPNEVSVLLGHRLQLDCMAHGHPSPSVTWRRDSQPTALIAATNSHHQQQQQQQLDQPPAVAEANNDQSAPLRLSSAAAEYSNVVSNYRQRAYLNGSLLIEQVELTDAGSFMCELANGVGTGLSKVVRVRVNTPPYFKQRTSTQLGQVGGKTELRCLVHGDQPMVVGWRKDNELAEFLPTTTSANANQQRQVVSEHRLGGQLFESLLSIENLTRADSGQYLCVASNEFGTDHLRLHLLVQEPPEAPNLLRPIQATSRQATLTFRPPFAGNSHIRKYAVSFRSLEASNASWQQTLLDAPPASSSSSMSLADKQVAEPTSASGAPAVNQTGDAGSAAHHLVNLNLCCLQAYTRYSVRVRALNDIGQSEPSKVVMFMTDEEAIGGPPLDVAIEPTGAHSLKVRWRAPARQLQNGLIRGYYIGYRAVGSSSTSSSSSSSGSSLGVPGSSSSTSLMSHTLSVVQSSSNVKVFEASDGEQYQYKNVQLEPPIPLTFRQQFVASGTSGSGGADNLQQVVLDAQLNGSTGTTQTQQPPQLATSYLTNLRRKTTYSIIVQAYNKVGAGPRSDQVLVSTLDAAPPMSPLLRLISVSYSSVQLVWSGRRFSGAQPETSGANGSSSSVLAAMSSSTGNKAHRSPLPLTYEENPVEEEEEDDPQSFYTINFKTDLSSGAESLPVGAGGSSSNLAATNGGSPEWQQRRLARRQQVPYTLSNLRCGSRYAAFMTATNSLGQSEPGDTIRFNTLGAAPLAPSTSRDFLQVNASQVTLRLAGWQNAGCIIQAFLIKYRAANQLKWTVIEHQVHPTIQTVTLSGAAVFLSRPQPDLSTSGQHDHLLLMSADEQQQQQVEVPADWQLMEAQSKGRFVNRRQILSDFVIRNLALSTAYRLVVEANSEAGNTLAEYELETGNLTSSLVSVHVNGISALDSLANGAGGIHMVPSNSAGGNHGRASLESTDSGELDFSYSGNQRAISTFQRYSLGVWSLTALFVVASVCMAATTLVIGFRSVIRMRSSLAKGSRPSNQLVSALLCCSSSSSAASSGAGSSHSSSGGTCYQLPVHDHSMLDAYCHGLMLNGATPERALATSAAGGLASSAQLDGGELKAIKADSMPFRQLAASSSLSTICRMNRLPNQQQQQQQQQASRHTNTLASASMCQGRRFSEESEPGTHLRAHYAATLGRKHSSFAHDKNQQPLKFNASPLYGHLQKMASCTDGQHFIAQPPAACGLGNAYGYQQQFVHPINSSSGTSGYETSNSQITAPAINNNNNNNSLYLHSALPDDAYQMNMFPPAGLAGNNLFAESHQSRQQEQNAMNDIQQQQQQQQYHYNLPAKIYNSNQQESPDELNLEAVYGALLANQQVSYHQNTNS